MSVDAPHAIEATLLAAVAAERGHFRYESGHHGDLWLDLDTLLVDAGRMRGWARALAERAEACRPDLVCGPLTGGAFLAQMLALELSRSFVFAERLVAADGKVSYRLPSPLRRVVEGSRVLLVDDAVNAGSALGATASALLAAGATLAGFACLLTLGDAAERLAAGHGVPLLPLARLERGLWPPADCPLCRASVPLTDRMTVT